MNRYCFKFLFFFSILSILSVSVFSEKLSSAEIANRQTAIRCAEVAKSFFMQEEYELAFSQAELGLAYDDKISDLWYVKAMCAKNQSKPKAQVLEFAQKSFAYSDWTYFAEDLGIVLYAEVLIQTGDFEKAYEVLENRKDIYSRDAEYLRALSSYLLGDVVKARNIISSAVNVFPEDVRFPKLFYKNEYFSSVFIGEEIDSGALTVASKLNPKISLWVKNFNDILFYASFFEPNEEVSKRMLLQFYSEYQLIPEAIPFALEKNILPQEQCRIAFENFSFDGIEVNLFKKIVSSFTDEKQKILCVSFLSKFSGIVTYDSNNDFISDMKVFYDAGRPKIIQQDLNQDDVIDSEIYCDFGTPSVIQLYSQNLELTYGTYPFVDSVKLFDNTNYFLVKDSYKWTNIDFVSEKIFDNFIFYLPNPILDVEKVDVASLFTNSYRISTEIEKENDVYQKRFVLSNGMPVQSTYAKNGIPYANAIFEGGHILYRNVDKNYDGLYELTEYYSFDTFNHGNFIDEEECALLYEELFGTIDALEGLYISKISIDDNNDEIPECSEEFFYNGKITTWFDANGDVSVCYEKKFESDSIIELSSFTNPITKQTVTVLFIDGTPKNLIDSQNNFSVLQNETTPIYWINNIPEDKLSVLVFESLIENSEQGKVVLLNFTEFPTLRVVAIRIGEKYFAECFEYEEEFF